MNILDFIERKNRLFEEDLFRYSEDLLNEVRKSRFLVIGGAGTIGQAVVKQIFKRNPMKLHVVDISENNLVELVRDLRSSFGYISGDFGTYALDVGSSIYNAFIDSDGNYDYVLNLSALKHVRSEKDPYTLMRMIDVNILSTHKTLSQSINYDVHKYFCVSTDKAANPVNMMGASKRIMEMFLMYHSRKISISTARFANVAFSDGSLLHGFNQRLLKKQPIVAPNDVRRYFLTPEESGELCLLSCLLGENADIFFPKLDENINLITFSSIAEKFVKSSGYEPYLCQSEEEAREMMKDVSISGKWPCLFQPSDTTGEKDVEEFFTEEETLDMSRFSNVGIVQSKLDYNEEALVFFQETVDGMKKNGFWDKADLLLLFKKLISNFDHIDKGKYLDSKM